MATMLKFFLLLLIAAMLYVHLKGMFPFIRIACLYMTLSQPITSKLTIQSKTYYTDLDPINAPIIYHLACLPSH